GSERARVTNDLFLINSEGRVQGLFKTYRLGGDNMHEGPTLNPRKDHRIHLARVILLAENEPAAGPSKRLMSGGRYEIRMRHRARVQSSGDETRDMRDVGHEHRIGFPRDFAHSRKINNTRIGAGAHGYHFRAMLAREAGQLIVINLLVVLADSVMNDIEKAA